MIENALTKIEAESKKRNILYIHGYGGTGNSRTVQALKTYLPDNYNVIELCFPLNPIEALKLADNTITERKIKAVVASSLGAFTALQMRCCSNFIEAGLKKIVINPCLYPSKELPKLTDISDDILQKFVEKEKVIEKTLAGEYLKDLKYGGREFEEARIRQTYGVFSTNDELFSYKDDFSAYYPNVLTIEDTHHISVENIKNVIVPLIEAVCAK